MTSQVNSQSTASSQRALVPVSEESRRIIPAKGGATYPDGFDKREWLTSLKQLKKEYNLEDRDRFRPLLRLKKEAAMKDFTEEIERMEKKYEIGLLRERTQFEFVQRQS